MIENKDKYVGGQVEAINSHNALITQIRETREEIRKINKEKRYGLFRTQIKEYIEITNLDNDKFARYTNINQEYLEGILAGYRNPPRRHDIVKIIKVLSHFLPGEIDFDIKKQAEILNYAGFGLTTDGQLETPLKQKEYLNEREWEIELQNRQIHIPGVDDEANLLFIQLSKKFNLS